ncbi:probable peptide/nitrate transporter At3g43790 [Branchiostoma floridae]|uniref:Probable peptide/nitrate transporter At3g43790 n=1 Tax=Branchiostoma floridae TaxID=7739 RepID=A0A9J7N1W7_BRAFL|nr:probable peptide/nitrate transporter At3g43790 [Branchiostoma floridae]
MFQWGKLADKFGRRPTLLAGSMTAMLTFLMFGFSFSFAWAVFALFLGGLLRGNLGIVKTYLYEVCPEKMHSVAFAVVSVASGLAYVVGPTVGGFLSCPATRFSSLDTSIFRRFPYLLPCITSMLVACVGLLVGFLFLEETKGRGRKGDQITTAEEINLRQVSG